MFHVKDGLYFQRLLNGDVHIMQKKTSKADEIEVYYDVVIDKNAWVSVIASVSNKGEDADKYALAKRLHED